MTSQAEINMQMAMAIGLIDGLRRHTWMKDGVSYVGNGTYTLKDAIEMLKKDYPHLKTALNHHLSHI